MCCPVATPPPALVVEDDPAVCRAHARLLRRAGYAVVTAGGVKEGLAQLRAHKPKLLLLDLELPDGHGFQLLRYVAATKARVLTVVVSGTSDPDAPAWALRLGASAFLPKPVHVRRILETIQKLTLP
jgi:DNA-binding NtrC family response regulator